jgi:hypothetical protein
LFVGGECVAVVVPPDAPPVVSVQTAQQGGYDAGAPLKVLGTFIVGEDNTSASILMLWTVCIRAGVQQGPAHPPPLQLFHIKFCNPPTNILSCEPWLKGPRSQVHVWDADGALQPLAVDTTTGLRGSNLVIKPNQLVAGTTYRITMGVTGSRGTGLRRGPLVLCLHPTIYIAISKSW